MFSKGTKMKTILIILFMLSLSTSPLFTQQQTDSTPAQTQKREQPVKQSKKGFFDENADGVNDRKKNGARDRFIDANGDGICDTREEGLGFRRGKNQGAHQSGKQQQRGKK
jgi:hypothetical protein